MALPGFRASLASSTTLEERSPARERRLVEPPRALDLAPQRERPPELDSDLRPRLCAPVRLQHHAQNAVDAEPGVPEAGVDSVHFAFGLRGSTGVGEAEQVISMNFLELTTPLSSPMRN